MQWVLPVEIKGLGFHNTWEHGFLTLVLIMCLKVKDRTDDVKNKQDKGFWDMQNPDMT